MKQLVITKKVYHLLRIFILLISALVWSRATFACSCILPEDPPAEFAKADAVFIGTVTQITDPSQVPLLHELVRFAHPVLNLRYEVLYNKVVHFEVKRSWKGVESTYVRIQTGLGGGDCGFHFVPGNEYLIYAYEQGGSLSTNICTRTTDAVDAIDDLAHLQAIQDLELTPETPPLRPGPIFGCLSCVIIPGVVIWLVCRKIGSYPVNGKT